MADPSSSSSRDPPHPASPPTDASKPPPTTGGHDFLPSTTLTNRFFNFYHMATNTMSPQGVTQYWADADTRYSELDCTRCESQRDYLLKYSPIIRFLSSNIRTLGGELDQTNIRCRTCKTGMLGGFDHRYGIVLCANWVEKRSMMEDVLAHEMVHAWDHLRFKTDLGHQSSLREVACSEVCLMHYSN